MDLADSSASSALMAFIAASAARTQVGISTVDKKPRTSLIALGAIESELTPNPSRTAARCGFAAD